MQRGSAESYRVFVRNWWRWEYRPSTYGTGVSRSKVPDPGARKTTLARGCTKEEARALCEKHAATHKPGPLSRKAEYERED
jgi:hypothetical protein